MERSQKHVIQRNLVRNQDLYAREKRKNFEKNRIRNKFQGETQCLTAYLGS